MMSTRKIPKMWIVLMALMAMVLAVSACAAPAAAPAADSGEMAADSGDEMMEEKHFRATIPFFAQDWSPLRGGGWNMHYLAFWNAGPMYIDEHGELHPYVFNEWTPNEDMTQWTFKIDPDAVYSDGSAITAQDVVATWNLIAHPATTHQRVTLFLTGVVGFEDVFNGEAMTMPGVVALDDSTVQVTLEGSDPLFHKKIATNLIGPVKASVAIGEDGFEVAEWWHPKNNPVTSGPLMPDTMDLNRGVVSFVKNPNFWVAEPKLDRLTVTSIEDTTIVTTMLANGELDQGWPPNDATSQALLGEDFFECGLAPGIGGFFLNPTIEPTSDINFRKALILAVDREQIFNLSSPDGRGWVPTGEPLRALPGQDPDFVPHPYDPEAAKEAMAASAYADVADVPKMIMAGVSSPGTEVLAQYMAEQWRQLFGIEAIEMSPQFDSWEGPGAPALFRDGAGVRVPDAALMLLGSLHSSSNLARNIMGGYHDPEVDALIEEAVTKGANDPDRIALAQQAQRLYHDQWMVIPIGTGCGGSAKGNVMPWVKGTRRNADAQFLETWTIDIVHDE
ncbi:MAG: ABC transporter substrate-binding protein [Caldilineaceae bacterium]|nr:ABC transporter substrate-binding protein [Caldilineaceae bacterium]